MGKAIYELGCQHCHHAYGESDLVLDNSKLTFKWLEKNIDTHTHKSIYEIIRKRHLFGDGSQRVYATLYAGKNESSASRRFKSVCRARG